MKGVNNFSEGVFKVDPKQRPSTAQMLQLVQHIAKEKEIDPSLPPFVSNPANDLLYSCTISLGAL